MAITGEDEAYQLPQYRANCMMYPVRQFIIGDMVRDWILDQSDFVLCPYALRDGNFVPADIDGSPTYVQHRWNLRTDLRIRTMFGKTVEEHGFRWDQYMQFIDVRVGAQYLITFAFVATHNHFVLDRGGNIFKQTAPVIKLPADATEDAHLGLLGLLNSSAACFWLKQVCFPRGGATGGLWDERLNYNATKVAEFPLTEPQPSTSLADSIPSHAS